MANLAKQIIKGSDLQVFLAQPVDGGNATFKTIGFATNCQLQLSSDSSDVSTKDFGSGWNSSVITKRSFTISCENLYATGTASNNSLTFDDLFSAYINGTELTVKVGCTVNAGADERHPDIPTAGWTVNATMPSYTGKVIVSSLSISGNSSDNASCSVEFTGVGALSKVV
jgi:predicted secreted protein